MVRVYVIRKNDRKNLFLKCANPPPGVSAVRSAGTANQREAERAAARWEQELQSLSSGDPTRILWLTAYDAYLTEHLASLKPSSQSKATQALLTFAERVQPRTIADADARTLSRHVKWLRDTPFVVGKTERMRSETTIDGHLTAIFAFLSWCKDRGYLPTLPIRPRVERSRRRIGRMKGRPITPQEYLRLVRSVPIYVKRNPGPWKSLIRGLYLSGLRLSEALKLDWETGSFHVDLTGKRPMFFLEAESDKGFKDRLLPISPEFWRFLSRTPVSERHGLAFKLPSDPRCPTWTMQRVSRVISEIGKKSGVIVSTSGKHVSSHDLRRSFGLRWASKIMPKDLMILMRHSNIETTMRYYVGAQADQTAETLWRVSNLVSSRNRDDASH